MTHRNRNMGLTKRLTGVVGIAAIASFAALPSLAQMNRPDANTTPTTEDTTTPAPNTSDPGATDPNTSDPNAPNPGATDPGAADPGATDSNAATSLDQEFLTLAYQGNNAEIKTSQLALERSQNQAVRQYAEQMISEHIQANEALTNYANQQNLVLPNEPVDPLNQAIAEQLSQLSGTEFDQAYMEAQTNAHLRTIALYQTQLSQGQEPGLISYAEQLIPNIQDHYQMASEMTPNYSAEDIRPGTETPEPIQ